MTKQKKEIWWIGMTMKIYSLFTSRLHLTRLFLGFFCCFFLVGRGAAHLFVFFIFLFFVRMKVFCFVFFLFFFFRFCLFVFFLGEQGFVFFCGGGAFLFVFLFFSFLLICFVLFFFRGVLLYFAFCLSLFFAFRIESQLGLVSVFNGITSFMGYLMPYL